MRLGLSCPYRQEKPRYEFHMTDSRQIKSAMSIAPTAKRHISLCGGAHHMILSGRSFRPPEKQKGEYDEL